MGIRERQKENTNRPAESKKEGWRERVKEIKWEGQSVNQIERESKSYTMIKRVVGKKRCWSGGGDVREKDA